jgi:hypothetical protein
MRSSCCLCTRVSVFLLIQLYNALFRFKEPVISFRPPLWSTSQSFWLQIQWPEFGSRRYKIFREVVGLKRGPLSLVNTTEELLERKSSGSCLENRECFFRDPSR